MALNRVRYSGLGIAQQLLEVSGLGVHSSPICWWYWCVGLTKKAHDQGRYEVALPWGSFLLQCQLCLLIEEERAQEEWEMWQRVVQSPYTNIQPSTTTCIDNYTPEKNRKYSQSWTWLTLLPIPVAVKWKESTIFQSFIYKAIIIVKYSE